MNWGPGNSAQVNDAVYGWYHDWARPLSDQQSDGILYGDTYTLTGDLTGISGDNFQSKYDLQDDNSRTFSNVNDTVIGGPNAGDGNVLANATGYGVNIKEAAQVILQRNFIDTDVNGTTAHPNSLSNISIAGPDPADDHVIGGISANQGNLISGSAGHGILIGENIDRTQIYGNIIGLNRTANAALPNALSGILFAGVNSNSRIGNYYTQYHRWQYTARYLLNWRNQQSHHQ